MHDLKCWSNSFIYPPRKKRIKARNVNTQTKSLFNWMHKQQRTHIGIINISAAAAIVIMKPRETKLTHDEINRSGRCHSFFFFFFFAQTIESERRGNYSIGSMINWCMNDEDLLCESIWRVKTTGQWVISFIRGHGPLQQRRYAFLCSLIQKDIISISLIERIYVIKKPEKENNFFFFRGSWRRPTIMVYIRTTWQKGKNRRYDGEYQYFTSFLRNLFQMCQEKRYSHIYSNNGLWSTSFEIINSRNGTRKAKYEPFPLPVDGITLHVWK